MYLSRPSAYTRTRNRVRATLWLACAMAVALPVWLAATFWLLEGSLASGAAFAPVGAYVGWRIVSELTDENDVGVSPLDRIWIQVERHLPNAGVRRAGGVTEFMGFKEGKLVFVGTQQEFEASKDPYISKFVMHNG